VSNEQQSGDPELGLDWNSETPDPDSSTGLQAAAAPPMVTRWSQKSPGLKILWIWTLGTAAIVVGGIVRMRVNDVQKMLQEEGEAAAAAATPASSERVLKDDE
ncbi:unnamed protein product, partial [Urochloa humidicola]